MARVICIDGAFATRRYRGVGTHRYLTSLLEGMERVAGDFDRVRIRVLVPSLAEIDPAPRARRGILEIVPSAAMRVRQVWKLGQGFSIAARRLGGDVAFLPFPAPLYLKMTPVAVTIHDLIPLLFPADFKSAGGRFLQHCFRTSLARADLVFTDSENSKKDMVSRFGIPEDRVVVAHLGIDATLFSRDAVDSSGVQHSFTQYGINRPFALHVGRLEPRKNLVRLVEAFRLLTERRKDLEFQLVLCGRPGPGSEGLFRILREPKLQGRVICTGAVSDRELAVLYRQATCFAMPSLYEGFGLPVLEAMASGCPVMSSNRSCLPEIAGDAALYFEPDSTEQISAAMERLLTDSAVRKQLVERGGRRARQFSWETCARTTLAALLGL